MADYCAGEGGCEPGSGCTGCGDSPHYSERRETRRDTREWDRDETPWSPPDLEPVWESDDWAVLLDLE